MQCGPRVHQHLVHRQVELEFLLRHIGPGQQRLAFEFAEYDDLFYIPRDRENDDGRHDLRLEPKSSTAIFLLSRLSPALGFAHIIKPPISCVQEIGDISR